MALRLHRLHALLTPNVSRNPKKTRKKQLIVYYLIYSDLAIIRRKATFSWTCTFHSRNQRSHESSEPHYGYCPINTARNRMTHIQCYIVHRHQHYILQLLVYFFVYSFENESHTLCSLSSVGRQFTAISFFTLNETNKAFDDYLIIDANEVPTVIHFH